MHDWYWEICPVTQVTGLFFADQIIENVKIKKKKKNRKKRWEKKNCGLK